MKTLTLIQAAILAVLAVVGAYAGQDTPQGCVDTPVEQRCEL
ncbi:hypothetical protein [Salipiger mucosus]|uniref:Uncharacterized protein n=1 Tax=Salipiger mucosus DSM 16094 TaxID=1123237 RepID=S9RQI2_9RHOB|nr:hypothetical protein [Salipiger mucosus]EPX76264.1 hypothetical protein Salmuc_01250 [Salipiger mucosus DSM 16094]